MNSILVVAVHPDDETLGCGGTLLRHRDQGDSIHWVILTAAYAGNNQSELRTVLHNRQEVKMQDIFSHSFELTPFSNEASVLKRGRQIDEVVGRYGFSSVHDLGFPATCLDQVPQNLIIGKLAEIFRRVQPNMVFLPFHSDVHSDHRVAFESAYSCTKSFRFPFIRKVLMMETMSETECAPALPARSFVPNYFVDISTWLDRKIEIFRIFRTEMGEHPFPRSETGIRALAAYRGATAGCSHAEAFMLLKEIV